MTHLIDQLCERVSKAASQNRPIRIVGGGTKNFYGGPLEGDTLDIHEWSGILSYEPTELVMSVKAGTPLSDVESALAEQGQELAFEPPRFGKNSTIGGAIVSGLSGPARLARGPVKDYLLGCTIIDGRGQLLHFGGTVMKNVAGYDVSRILPGSMGTLGLAVDLSIKVLPKAPAQITLQFDMDTNEAIRKVNEWLSSPLPINASVYLDGTLFVRLRGAHAAVAQAAKTLGGQKLEDKAENRLWEQIRDQKHTFFKTDGDVWRLSVPPTTPDLALDGETLIEWGGGLRWFKPTEAVSDETIRRLTERVGGHATLYISHDFSGKSHTFHPPQAAMLNLQKRLKNQFDPAGIFNRNRMAPLF